MNKLIVTVAAAAMLIPSTSYSDKAAFQVCKDLSATAEAIMTSRQSGTNVNVILDMLEQSINRDHPGYRPNLDIITKAYKKPVLENEHDKEMEIFKFSNDYLTECIGKIERNEPII